MPENLWWGAREGRRRNRFAVTRPMEGYPVNTSSHPVPKKNDAASLGPLTDDLCYSSVMYRTGRFKFSGAANTFLHSTFTEALVEGSGHAK